MSLCLRCHVSGRVQGVWFRAGTRQQALALGLTGHAINLPDGRVEVMACGEPERLLRLQEWLWQGPPAAQVSDVQCVEIDGHLSPADFATG